MVDLRVCPRRGVLMMRVEGICWMTALRIAIVTFTTVALAQGGNMKSSADARVVLVMTDGLRWQEVFRGADESLLVPARYYEGRSVDALKERYLGATPEIRREKLMPFLWSTLVPQGQIYGDRDAGSD